MQLWSKRILKKSTGFYKHNYMFLSHLDLSFLSLGPCICVCACVQRESVCVTSI